LDRRIYNKSPKFMVGWNNTLTYKDLSLTAMSYARVGQWLSYDLNLTYLSTQPGGGAVLDYWTPENQNAKFPRPGIVSDVDLPALAFEKASFLKIKEVILSYSVPAKFISRLGLSSLRIYGSMQNYFIFSNMDNYDPERGGSLSDPLLKQMVFGLNLEF
jgi:TonB-dependent starch-binding outer membrane protein SusC